MKNIKSTTRFIQTMLMMTVSACAAVIVILTITNCNYICEASDNYFIPYIVIMVFTAISGISFWMFIKLWNLMFLK